MSERTINPKNIDGSLGPRCNYCSGLGFTTSVKGQSLSCHLCFGTGVEAPNIYEMAEKLDKLVTVVDRLVKVIESK